MKEPQFKAWHKDKKCWVSICPQTGYGLDLDKWITFKNYLKLSRKPTTLVVGRFNDLSMRLAVHVISK